VRERKKRMQPENVKYRWLEPAEFGELDGVFDAFGWARLNEQVSRVLVAEVMNQIVGFTCFQLTPQLGPEYVTPMYRGVGIAEELASGMIRFMKETDCRGYFAIADSEFTARLCEDQGMKLLERPVYIKISAPPEVQ
jgi:hypothetical protein